MADDLIQVLTRFHREVVMPDVERVLDERLTPVREEMRSFRDDTNAHFDSIYQKFAYAASSRRALCSRQSAA